MVTRPAHLRFPSALILSSCVALFPALNASRRNRRETESPRCLG